MKMTLLSMTQSILSGLSSDEVNSISDTTESLQVAEIIKQVYMNISARAGIIEQNQLFQLDPSLDSTKPVIMYKPEHINKIEWIKYYDTHIPATSGSNFEHDLNVDITAQGGSSAAVPQWKYVTILPIQQFLDYVNNYNVNDTTVDAYVFQTTSGTFNLLYKNNVSPRFCTILQNYYVLFDSYDNTVDSTLQTNKTQCLGQGTVEWSMTDSFVPNLDENQFPLLLNEAKALAFLELKQMSHPKAEQEAKRQWGTIQRTKSLANSPTSFQQLPDFGRRKLRWR
jgi:hypothetical protein